ncbi:MAG: glutamine--tRNA ligase [Deltaproteobacteria bacterium]|nr:MAG: glutamine--tRNA ligase [Deltaproteobacteria bacterium]
MANDDARRDNDTPEAGGHFIEEIIDADLAAGRHSTVVTRFPPEPNGYLHIGHAKSIALNFGLAKTYGGRCNLRFDDTNPTTEDTEYVEAIQQDIRWLGFDWEDRLYFASDYFEQLYGFAVELIEVGKAYVCDLDAAQIRDYRGDYHTPGRNSPHRDRSVEENLDLFARMRAGEFGDGEKTLRAKIDMQASNMNLRDPPLYRIRHAYHHRTGDSWCIYPMYDFAHALSDAIEGITHSLCTLEFENHRPLYDWCVDNVPSAPARPRQIEFAKLNLSHTVMSKRRLKRMVEEKIVDGWDDPRMPTIAGMRRRGYTPESFLRLAERVGVAKTNSLVDIQLFEHTVRDHLNESCKRAMGVLRPLKLVITNLDEDAEDLLDAPFHPEDPSWGSRKVPFCRELYIERDDFREEAPRKWFRLAPGKEVRLRWACLLTCDEVIKDDSGEVVELRCSWDPDSRGGNAPDGRKVRGTLHWVSARHAIDAEVRLYDRLFGTENPLADDGDFLEHLNADSLITLVGCKLEPALADAEPGSRWQFERLGYFCADESGDDNRRTDGPVFNRTITLRDTWAKIEAKLKETGGR